MRFADVAVAFALLLLSGCSATQQVAEPAERVEIISMTPLPPIMSLSQITGMKLNVLMHVLKDGTVENIRMLGSSGDAEWDSLALQSMKQWRYAPPHREGVLTDLWFRQLVVVQIQEPIVMTIGELVCSSSREADSLYSLLGRGVDLDHLFRQKMTTLDIHTYPQKVRNHLKDLGKDEHAAPLRVGENYMIYKRFRDKIY